MTFLDRWDNFLSTYVRKTKEPELPPKRVEDDVLFRPSDFDEESTRFSFVVDGKNLTQEMRRRMALSTPFYMKGLRKKCRDTFRAGWSYKNKDGKIPAAVELKVLDDFNKRNNIEHFMELMKQDAHVYGDGFCLILFANDQQKKSPDLSKAPSKTALPYKLKRLDPEKITKYEYKNEYWRNKNIQHLIYENKSTLEKKFIHPDRLIIFKETEFAFSKFGISDIDILRHVISSQADIDIATGELLKWFSYGIIEWTKEGANANAMKEMRKIAEKHPHIYTGNEKYSLKVHNPEAIDPKPFFDHLIMSIAAVLVMPTHVLKGIEVGKTTGAEMGYADYHKDIRDSQNLIYAPGLVSLYTLLFDRTFEKRVFDYIIDFNPTYVGELAEAEVDAKRSATAVNLKVAGIIDTNEARQQYNEGHIYLDPDKKIEQMFDKMNDKGPIEQNPRTEQAIPKKEKEDVSDDNKLKSNLDILDFDDIGKIEEVAQEKRVAMAELKKRHQLEEKIKRIKNAT